MPHSQAHTPSAPSASSKKRFMMPAVVAGLLGSHVCFVMVAITLATGDRSFAVVPDYYQRAVVHDDRKAALAASDALGWTVQLRPAADADHLGQRGIVLVLSDSAGQPLSGATVSVTGYHLARAGEPITVPMSEVLPGQYAGQGKLAREGFWQFEVEAQHGGQAYVNSFKQFVVKPEAN